MKKIILAIISLLVFASPVQALDFTVETKLDPPSMAKRINPRPNKLPDGEILTGSGSFTEAWLSHPTTRYQHGVLGDAIEAGGITLSMRDGTKRTLVLSENSVFEDRLLRPVNIDGRGESEFLVVRSYLGKGAAIAAVGLVNNKLKIVAEAAPIGLRHRWLNPVGAGDFDGDGRIEIAVVITPHIGGTLTLYGYQAGRFVGKYSAFGFSNHAYGSRELGMSATGDVDGDGTPELFVPDENRRDIRVVSFKGRQFRELARIKGRFALDGPLEFSPANKQKKATLTYPLKSGQRVTITFTP